MAQNREILRWCGKIIVFCAILAVCYGAVVRIVVVRLPGPMRSSTTVPLDILVGQTRLMAEEASASGPVDILFVGSSHVYQTFDPRFFDTRGIRTFNLATTAQAPLQSYYLTRQYLNIMDPQLVVVEIWMTLLAGRAVESAIDLIVNLPLSKNLFLMTAATRDIRAYNALLHRIVDPHGQDPARKEPRMIGSLRYMGRGFAEPTGSQSYQPPWTEPAFVVEEEDLDYLKRIATLVRQSGAEVTFVLAPIPRETLDLIPDRIQVEERLRQFAHDVGVSYIDFSNSVTFDTDSHFAGWHHLSREGVTVFLPQFLEELARRGLLQGMMQPSR